MTKAEYQEQNDKMRQQIAAYQELGTPEQIKERIDNLEMTVGKAADAARSAETTLSMIRKLLA